MNDAKNSTLPRAPQKIQEKMLVLGILYFIIVIWVFVFKCNMNSVLHLEWNRSMTLPERLKWGLSKKPIEHVIASIKRGGKLELLTVIFNVIGFIPCGIFFRHFIKKRNALLSSLTLSIAIEIFQLVTCIGGFEPTDIILNTLGGFVGIILYEKLFHKISLVPLNATITVLICLLLPFDVFIIIKTANNWPW